MLIRPQTLSLITTHQCTAACDNCCFTCTPRVTRAIPVPRLRTLIDEAAAISSIKVVVFTGGECFLLGRELDALITRAAKHGLLARCVTNGYWGKSPEAARKRVKQLVAAGLIEINFSTGPMHARYVPLDSVINAAAASAEAGLTTVINVEIFDGCDFDVTPILKHEVLSGRINKKRVLLQRNMWINNAEGRGKMVMKPLPEHSRFRPEFKSACSTVMNVIAITPAQDLVACCGLHLESIPELHLGNIAERSLQSVLNQAPDDLVKIWMHLDGPEVILEFVKKHESSYQLPTQSVHPCETCQKLYTDPVVKRVLREYYREVEDDLVKRYVNAIAIKEVTLKAMDIQNFTSAMLASEDAALRRA
jgi:hypothetical protein